MKLGISKEIIDDMHLKRIESILCESIEVTKIIEIDEPFHQVMIFRYLEEIIGNLGMMYMLLLKKK